MASTEALYRDYASDVFALAVRTVGSRAEAEDVAQTTFLNAHRALLGGAEPENERAWLLTIARNICRRRFSVLARRPREEPLDESLLPASHGGDDASPQVLAALRELLPKQREAIVLQAVHGCSTSEIGAQLGLGRSAVDALLFRARASMRDALEATGGAVDCARSDAFVERQLARELDDREQAALRAHLRGCESCAARARSLRARKRAPSLLLFPWQLIGRLAGLFGHGGAGVQAAAVIGVIAVGATSAVEGPRQESTAAAPRPPALATTTLIDAGGVAQAQEPSSALVACAQRRTRPERNLSGRHRADNRSSDARHTDAGRRGASPRNAERITAAGAVRGGDVASPADEQLTCRLARAGDTRAGGDRRHRDHCRGHRRRGRSGRRGGRGSRGRSRSSPGRSPTPGYPARDVRVTGRSRDGGGLWGNRRSRRTRSERLGNPLGLTG